MLNLTDVTTKRSKAGWTTVAFGDAVRQVKDKVDPDDSGLERYVAGEHMDTDDLRLRRWGDIGDGYLGPAFHMRFKPGHVLYGSRRTYLRKVAVADFEGITANTTYVLESKDPSVLLPELLPFIMQTEAFNQHSVRESKGSVNPYVNFSDLAWYEFALPPIEEQRRLAEVLQAVEAAKESGQALTNIVVAATAAFAECFIQQNPPDTALDAVLDSIAYGTSERASNQKVGLPVLRIPNVVRGAIILEDLKWIEMNKEDEERYRVDDGDVLIVRTNGNPDYVGRCVVARQLPGTFAYASYLIRLRTEPDRLVPEFLTAMLNAPTIRRTMRGSIRSSAGNYNLNTKGIRSQRIPLPSIGEQEAFLRVYAAIGSGAARTSKRVSELRRLQCSLLEEVAG